MSPSPPPPPPPHWKMEPIVPFGAFLLSTWASRALAIFCRTRPLHPHPHALEAYFVLFVIFHAFTAPAHRLTTNGWVPRAPVD